MDLYEIILLLVSLHVVSIFGTPIPDSSPQRRRELSDTLDTIALTAGGILSLGAGVAQEVLLLDEAISKVKDGEVRSVETVENALASLSKIHTASDHSLFEMALYSLNAGLAPPDILDLAQGLLDRKINSIVNENPRDPMALIFPTKDANDAPYSLTEPDLRGAVYIPEGFEHGANGKRPVLLVPGTAIPSGSTYYFNYEKLLAESDFADTVWVNIPGNSLNDVQINSEYVAYAINYIYGIANNTKIGIISWSQGGLDVQWALKYWPSTREAVEDFMPVSADFHGTLLDVPCILSSPLCTPAIKQQGYNSTLIHTLRADGGDSAYVPTTSVYSGVDEIVQPQIDPDASGALKDIRGVGAANTPIQLACRGKPAGSFYFHSTMLVNPLAYALFVDALTHEGPGDLSRIDLDTVCDQLLPPMLGLKDLLGTETVTTVLGPLDTLAYALSHVDDNGTEPAVMAYARS